MIATVGNKRGLRSSITRYFDITITFVNSINRKEGNDLEITFDGDSKHVGTVTIYAPAPGST